MTNIFDFDNEDTKLCLDILIRSGMIKSNYSPNARDKVKFLISSKGEFALSVFFSDIHYLYYNCINTLLPETIIEEIKISSNNFPLDSIRKKYYPPFSIKTGMLFLQHLINCNNYKLTMVKNKNLAIDVKSYKLPINLAELERSIEKMVIACFKDKEYQKLIFEYFPISKN